VYDYRVIICDYYLEGVGHVGYTARMLQLPDGRMVDEKSGEVLDFAGRELDFGRLGRITQHLAQVIDEGAGDFTLMMSPAGGDMQKVVPAHRERRTRARASENVGSCLGYQAACRTGHAPAVI